MLAAMLFERSEGDTEVMLPVIKLPRAVAAEVLAADAVIAKSTFTAPD